MTVEFWMAALLIATTLWLVTRIWRNGQGKDGLVLPRELRRAELVYSEALFRVEVPEPISARVDRSYQRRDGMLVLLELKTRRHARVYLSDVIELSAQRVAQSGALGQPVSAHAYVLI